MTTTVHSLTATRPTHVSHPLTTRWCAEMRAHGREELVHYAGAAHRDPVAWQMCLAWQHDPSAPEATLKSRALAAAGCHW